MKTLPLSIIILFHRVDARLHQALKSVAAADQVLLIYCSKQSLDKNDAAMLQEKYNCELHFHPVTSQTKIDFAAIRNQAATHASHDWILFLDSDEEVSSESWPAIENLLTQQNYDPAFLRRHDVLYSKEMKWGETGTTWLIRMGRKSALHFTRPVHETVAATSRTTYAPIKLLHYPHTSIEEFFNKITMYAKIEAYYRWQQSKPFSLFELCFFPAGKFISNYCYKLGFLDGWRGLIYAVVMSLHSLFVRVFLYQAYQTNAKK